MVFQCGNNSVGVGFFQPRGGGALSLHLVDLDGLGGKYRFDSSDQSVKHVNRKEILWFLFAEMQEANPLGCVMGFLGS